MRAIGDSVDESLGESIVLPVSQPIVLSNCRSYYVWSINSAIDHALKESLLFTFSFTEPGPDRHSKPCTDYEYSISRTYYANLHSYLAKRAAKRESDKRSSVYLAALDPDRCSVSKTNTIA